MIMGAWGIGGKKAPTAKSYVQDGLIAMWDGIENAGYGVHDSVSTTWKDLIGTCDLVLTSNGTWGNNHLVVSNTSASLSTHDLPSVPMTIEAVIERSGGYAAVMTREITNGKAHGLFRNDNETDGIGYYFDGNGNLSTIVLCGDEKVYTAGTWNSADGTASSVYYNGQPSTNATRHGSRWIAPSGYLHIGGTGSLTYRYGFYGKIYSLRMYSRAITSSEIAANYAVDKQRFNLP